MATHTWKFYLTAGRTWGGPRISGATIAAYSNSTQTGSSMITALTTDSNGYATYQTSGDPLTHYWRINLGNNYGIYYKLFNVIGGGDANGYYGIPNDNFNTKGVAIVLDNYNSLGPNNYTKTVYFYAVGQNISMNGDKCLTYFDIEALSPPGCNYLSSSSSQSLLNKCITGTEIISYYESDGAFSDALLSDNNNLVSRYQIQEYHSFISGSSVTPSLSDTSIGFLYNACDSSYGFNVTGSCQSDFYPVYEITGSSKSYFTTYPTSISNENGVYKFNVKIYPTETNYSGSYRTATVVVKLYKTDKYAWYGGTINSAKITVTQGYHNSGGSSGSTGGGGTTGGTTGGGTQT